MSKYLSSSFTETTISFKQQQPLSRHISIPDVLHMQGQVARCHAETYFNEFVTDNLQRLRRLSEPDLIQGFTDLKLNLRQGLCLYWHERHEDNVDDSSRSKEAQSRCRLTAEEAAERRGDRAA